MHFCTFSCCFSLDKMIACESHGNTEIDMRQNTTLVREAKFINFLASLLLFTAGFILLFVPLTAASLGMKILVGVLFIVIGGAKMLGYFSNDLYRLAFQFDFAIGIFSGRRSDE